jgi:hypothetical protein
MEKIWYQASDYTRIQNEMKESVEIALRKGLSAFVKQTYGSTDSQTQDMLNLWAKCRDSRRGLERFVNEEYRSQRFLHSRKLVQAVLFSQEKLRKDNQTYARAAAIIQTVSSTLSSNAIHFARMLAIADREAVLSKEEEEEERKNTILTASKIRSLPGSEGSKHAHIPVLPKTQARIAPPHRPPRHPGRFQYEIKVSPLA